MVERMLDPGFRAEMRARCAELTHANGAQESAHFIQELTHTLRADLGPRGFWS